MGYICNDEFKDKYVGKYGVVIKELPVKEGVITVGSVIYIDSCSREGTEEDIDLIYNITEYETGKKFSVPKRISETRVASSLFLDENIGNLTKEGVLYYARQFRTNYLEKIICIESGHWNLLSALEIRVAEKTLQRRTLKKFSVNNKKEADEIYNRR